MPGRVPAEVAALPLVHVLAGVLEDAAGRVLLAERPAAKAFAGRWEFPGGKLEAGESPREALARELQEELGIDVLDAEPLLAVTHHYPGAPVRVLIDSWRVSRWRGEARALDGQRLRWCATAELAAADILEADRPIVTALRLPRLIVLRDGDVARPVVDDPAHPPAGGIVLHTSPARLRSPPRPGALVGCVVRAADEVQRACERGADFLVAPADLDDGALEVLARCGLPWYLDERRAAHCPVRPTGLLRWSGPSA